MRLLLLMTLGFTASLASADPIMDFNKEVKAGEAIYSYRDYQDCPIIKIESDFDQDGDLDYLLSSRCPYGNVGDWGNAGGTWQVYFNLGRSFRKSGTIFFHPLSAVISPTGNSEEFEIESYRRSGCCEGSFVTEVVGLGSQITVGHQSYTDMNLEGSKGSKRYESTFTQEKLPSPKICLVEDLESGACVWEDGYY